MRLAICLLFAAAAVADAGGRRGMAAIRLADGGIGAPISGVELRFTREDGSTSQLVTSSIGGRYEISLPPARYYVFASHPDFQDYASAPGFAVVSKSMGTMNVFLREPAATTVLLVRHGERTAGDDLTPDGRVRAQTLKETVWRAAATAVYSTNFVRTRGTVSPYADAMKLPIIPYNTPADLVAAVEQDHRGDVVLVAAHSDTVGQIAQAFGAAVPAGDIEEFDNLYVITKAQSTAALNLQYGADSLPDRARNGVALTTLLLVSSAKTPKPADAQTLLHSLRKAGVAAIRYNGSAGLVQPLASLTSLTPVRFTAATRKSMLSALLTNFAGQVVLISGTNADVSAIISLIKGDLTPILYATDTANLVVATQVEPKRSRVVPLLFLP
jgi:hypothetical protein